MEKAAITHALKLNGKKMKTFKTSWEVRSTTEIKIDGIEREIKFFLEISYYEKRLIKKYIVF